MRKTNNDDEDIGIKKLFQKKKKSKEEQNKLTNSRVKREDEDCEQ